MKSANHPSVRERAKVDAPSYSAMVDATKIPRLRSPDMMNRILVTRLHLGLAFLGLFSAPEWTCAHQPMQLLRQYCFECHDDVSKESGLDLVGHFENPNFDGTLVFENLVTEKMPPADAEQPSPEERTAVLKWIAERQPETPPASFRRISRYEFVSRVNDLLGTKLDVAHKISDDRGTNDFDSDRRIKLSREVLGAYFSIADEMLDFAFPKEGFPAEKTWVTNRLMESHETYRIYVRDYQDGILFSWTRANNGNSYSFFYDDFVPHASGWYDLTFDAMKIGEFEEDISIQVHAGKYYYADDRPQPQRLLDVISLGTKELKSHTIRVFLNAGENVSVHCYSKHNFREENPQRGAYIKQMKARGPLQDQWPPSSYQTVFGRLIDARAPNGRSLAPTAKLSNKVSIATESPEDLTRVVRRFATKAFSSDLSDSQLKPYIDVGLADFMERSDFVGAAKVALKAIICSPRFLMVPGEHSNSSYSRAADLARALWLSVPDEELLRLAASDELSGVTLVNQIDRMLRDGRSEQMIEAFCAHWLKLRSWHKVTPSLKLYPQYDDLLNHYLPIETRAYLHHLIRENLSVTHLIDSNFSFLNQRLAQHYDIDGIVGQRLRKVSFGPEVPRGGLLTMGSVLKITTDGFDTSPILRGAWISKNIVGTPLSPPPENVGAIEPQHGEAAETLREQIERHKTSAACYACHKSIDPYGFAFENFDATGRWRTRYRIENPHKGTFQFKRQGYYRLGGDVDASGMIDGSEFDDVFGLKNSLLADHRQIAYNFAKKFFEYANGYQPHLQHRLELFSMLNEESDGCRMKNLVTKVLVYSLSGEEK